MDQIDVITKKVDVLPMVKYYSGISWVFMVFLPNMFQTQNVPLLIPLKFFQFWWLTSFVHPGLCTELSNGRPITWMV